MTAPRPPAPRPVVRPLRDQVRSDEPVLFVTNALRPRGLRARAQAHRPVLAVVVR